VRAEEAHWVELVDAAASTIDFSPLSISPRSPG